MILQVIDCTAQTQKFIAVSEKFKTLAENVNGKCFNSTDEDVSKLCIACGGEAVMDYTKLGEETKEIQLPLYTFWMDG